MAVSTVDFFLRPEDGWTLIATNPTKLLAKTGNLHPWWVAITTAGAPPTSASRATGTLTFTGNAVAAETVTIDGVVYTWRAAPAVPNEVLIGGTVEASIDNLVAGINNGATGGSPHPTVDATKGSPTTLVATAKLPGSSSNTIATTETMLNASWGGATLSGGVDALIGIPMGADTFDTDEAFEASTITGEVYAIIRQPLTSVDKFHLAVFRDQ